MISPNKKSQKRYILSIQGPQAVGKTTILKRLQERMPDVHFVFEKVTPLVNKRNNLNLDINTEEGFIENQRIFIEAECDNYDKLPSGNIIVDRGIEDIECYTLTYPISINKNWDIEEGLKKELEELRDRKSDYILYFEVSDELLKERKLKDTSRSRSTFDIKRFKIEKEWFMQKPNIEIINLDGCDIEEAEEIVYRKIKEIISKG